VGEEEEEDSGDAREGVNVVEIERVVGRESWVVEMMKAVGLLGFTPGSGPDVIIAGSIVDDAAVEAGSPAVESPLTRLW